MNTKLVFKSLFVIILLLITSVFYLSYQIKTVYAQSAFPQLKLPCNLASTRDPEFHSLRPYQAAPCGDANKAYFCSNDLIFIETFNLEGHGDCHPRNENGDFSCNPDFHVEPHDLYVELDGSQFPIMGNTENVKNSLNNSDELDDATKVNEYVSWYLNGVIDKAENKEATESQIVNFSGPIRKLLPSIILDAQKIDTIDSATTETTYFDDDIGKEVTEAENHDQLVVDGDRLSTWKNGDLSFLRGISNNINDFVSTYAFGFVGNIINQVIDAPPAWNKRYPPLPWADEEGEPFEKEIYYQKAYGEWQGKSCFILFGFRLVCFDNPVMPNKYSDNWQFVPLANTSDKKGAQMILGDGPSYTGAEGTVVENDMHRDFHGAALHFAHTQEVKDLSEALNKTYQPGEGSKEGKDTKATGNNAARSDVEFNSCSAVNIRQNKGDNLFPGDPNEMEVLDVQYDITGVECHEEYDEISEDGCGLLGLKPCTRHIFKCPAYVEIRIHTATKTPFANEIFSSTVAGSDSTFRKIYPKVDEGSPIDCIADIPTSTDVTYDTEGTEIPKGGTTTFKVKDYPEDGNAELPQLTFPHIGSVYEYFLKGIQTALRPKGYGDPIVNGTLCKTPEESKCEEDVRDSEIDSKYLGDFKANFIDLANRWSAKCPGAENNQAEQCYNYVVREAKKAGVNPAFALTIWLNESGASNYCEGGETTQDFGINIPSLYQKPAEQLKFFLQMAKIKLCTDVSGFSEPMNGWLSRFQSSAGVCDPTDTTAMQYYIDVRDTTWAWVTGCSSASRFGITWPTDMSCP